MSGYCLLACRRDLFVFGGEVAMAFQSNQRFQGGGVMGTVVVYEVINYQLTSLSLGCLCDYFIFFFILFFFTWEGLDAVRVYLWVCNRSCFILNSQKIP